MEPSILSVLPLRLKQAIEHIPGNITNEIEEIRLRVGRPIECIVTNQSFYLTESGLLSQNPHHGLKATPMDGQKLLNVISRHSVYAIEEELRRGFITISGGHRVGIAGRVIVEQGHVKFIKDIASFNIRIAREMKGIANQVLSGLLERGRLKNSLLISPPQCGKTTLLRDLIRLLSDGWPEKKMPGYKVGVVDERSEIASCLAGVPQHDLGSRTDVLDACPKAEGIMMLIRSMSPHVIACDEIGSKEDAAAIIEAVYAGVSVLASAHGSSLQDIQLRPNLAPLFRENMFERFVILSRRQGAGTIEAVVDHQGRQIGWEREGMNVCLS